MARWEPPRSRVTPKTAHHGRSVATHGECQRDRGIVVVEQAIVAAQDLELGRPGKPTNIEDSALTGREHELGSQARECIVPVANNQSTVENRTSAIDDEGARVLPSAADCQARARTLLIRVGTSRTGLRGGFDIDDVEIRALATGRGNSTGVPRPARA